MIDPPHPEYLESYLFGGESESHHYRRAALCEKLVAIWFAGLGGLIRARFGVRVEGADGPAPKTVSISKVLGHIS